MPAAMRVAFFGLTFHQRTGSIRFFLDLLRQHAEVTAWFAEPNIADVRRCCVGFDEADFDAIVVFQLHHAFVLLSGRHPNVVFVPMYDAMFRGGAFTWRPSFSAAKVLCFSWALRQEVMRRAPVYAQAQYYPPLPDHNAVDFSCLRGFLWYRRRDIPPERIFALTADSRFDRLTIHDAPDPGHAVVADWVAPGHVGRLIHTQWSSNSRAFAEALSEANVFFAPRLLEGIGMGFLEAMAAGLCVVANDAPTMNEVISHGANGLLYTPARQAALDFTGAREMGARAREDVVRGRARWEAGIPRLLDFVFTPTADLRARGEVLPLSLPLPPPRHNAIAVVATMSTNGLSDQCDCASERLVPSPHETLAALLARCHAEWVLILPPGDRLWGPGAMAALLGAAGPDTVAVCGHALVTATDGSEQLLRADVPEAAWRRLLQGEVRSDGPAGMPIPAATIVRRQVLARFAPTIPESAAALAAIVLAASDAGGDVLVCNAVVARCAVREAGTLEAERRAWLDLVRQRAGEAAMVSYAASVAMQARAAGARRRASRAARLGLGLVAAIDRRAPMIGWMADHLLFGAVNWSRTQLARLYRKGRT